MEERNLSDADTDELLGISGIEPFGSGASVYLTPTKSPPGSPSDLLASSPKRRPPANPAPGCSPANARISPSRGASGHSSPSRSRNDFKSPKHAVKKFVDSPGKLKIGDLKGNDQGIRRSSSQERLVNVRRYLLNQEIVQEGLKLDSQNKENLSNSVGVVDNPYTKINSAPTSGTKSLQEIGGIGGKSLPSSPYKVQNVVVTSHHRLQGPPSGISWSDPNAPPSRTPAKPLDPIFTYKRKLFQDDDSVEANEKLKNKTVAAKNKKGPASKDKSNKKTPPNKSAQQGVVHSGSPTQQTHSASKYKVSPRSGEGGATAKMPGKQQRASRSLDNSPEKRPSSIMKGGGSVSPGRRPGPVTFHQSPNSSNSSPKSLSPPKYSKSSPDRVSNSQKHKYTEQSSGSAYLKTGRSSAQPMSQSGVQYSPEKYEKSFENTPATSGYYSGKSAFTQEGYSNPLDDFLEQYPLSPLRGDTDMSLPGSLPDSPGMKAAAETVPTAEDYDDMPREVYADVTSFDIEEMEGARDSLRTMMKLSTKTKETHLNLGNSPHNESISTFRSYPEEGYHDKIVTQHNDSFEEVAAKALMGSQNEIDYDQALQLTSQLLGRDKDVSASTLEMENQVLLDNMEREKFRRQHCEKQIGNLQSRLLETQEQLAVATSTEKKKDIMIEQLDKTLSRVVEGWKKREAEKKEYIEALKGEKEEFESRYHTQKDMLEKFEERLQKASKDLESEQRRVAELEENKVFKLEQHEDERQQWAEALDNERSRREQAEEDHDRTREGLEHVQAQVDNLQDTLNRERHDWSETERNLRKKLADLEEAYKRDIENEKRQVKDQTQHAKETRDQLNTANIDLQKTRLDLETALRERDSLKMEMSLLEARMESSKRQLEADLTSEFEKALSEKMNEAHDKLVSTETDLREGHRKQIQDLNRRHREDMEEQMATMTEDFKKKETYLKEQSKTYEERLEEAQDENRELKAVKHKMELQRIEMANRMQSMMQTHCSEALTLLNNSSQSPTKSYQHDSVLSHIPSLADQTKSSPGDGADQPPDGISDQGANVSTKLPVDGALVVTRPNRVHHDDGVISDVLSTEGDNAIPTYTISQQIGGVQNTYVPPISISHLPQQPVTNLDSNRSSNFGSASQVTSHYPYSSISYQAHMPVSAYQPSNTYSSVYEPNGQPHALPYGNGPIRSAFTSTQNPHQPIMNNYSHQAPSTYSNPPIGSSYTSQPIANYHNHNQPMNTSYTNPPVGSQINQPMKNHYLPGPTYSNQSNYNTASQRPQVVTENVTKSDYGHLYNGNGNISEPSAPSLSSGYSSVANHSSRYVDPMRNGESQHDSGKDESTDMVSLLNGSTATHNDTCVSDISTRMQQHNQRQQELEHYVRMLLGKEPGIPATNGDKKNMVAHSPPQKLEPDSKQTSNHGTGSAKEDSRLVSTAHAPKYGSVMGLAREKLHMKRKGQEDQPAERKSTVRKSRDGPIGKTTAKPWR